VMSILPRGHIWLRDAWEQALEALEDYSKLTIALDETWPPNVEEDPRDEAAAACQNARYRVERRMRDALADRELIALTIDLRTGLMGELPDREKWRSMSLSGLGGVGLSTLINAVENPGPLTGLPVIINKNNLRQWLNNERGQPSKTIPSGRPPEFRWSEIKEFAFAQMREHGVPGPQNRKFPAQEDLVTLVIENYSHNYDRQPSPSNVRRRLKVWRSEFEQIA